MLGLLTPLGAIAALVLMAAQCSAGGQWQGEEQGLWSQRDTGVNAASTLKTHCGTLGTK